MFSHVKYLVIFLLVSAINVLSQCQMLDTSRWYGSQSCSCEEMQGYYRVLGQMTPLDAFAQITAPLVCNRCPPQLSSVRNLILQYVASNNLNINYLISHFNFGGIENRNDLLIALLLSINQNPNLNLQAKNDVATVIYFLLNQRYLIQDYDRPLIYRKPNIINPPLYLQYPQPTFASCGCKNGPVQPIQPIQPIQPMQPIINRMITTATPSVTISEGMRSQPISRFTTSDFINLIPQPIYPLEKEMYGKFTSLINSDQFKTIWQSLNPSEYSDSAQMLQAILEKMNAVSSGETKELIQFYGNFKEAAQAEFNYGNLLTVLPQPLTPTEQVHYNNLRTFLTSKNIYNTIRPESLKGTNDLSLKFKTLLENSSTQSLSPEILEAVKYYHNILKTLERGIHFDKLVRLLPQPVSAEERVRYIQMKNILESHDIYTIMQDQGLSRVTDNNSLLKLVLRELVANSRQKEVSLAAMYYRNRLFVQEIGFNPFDLLNLLPQTSATQIGILYNYFHSAEFAQIASELNVAQLPDQQKLLTLCDALTAHSTDQDVVKAAQFVQQVFRQLSFSNEIESFIQHHFSQEKRMKDQSKFVELTQFLRTPAAGEILQGIDRSLFPDDKLYFEYVLKSMAENVAEESTKRIFNYYLDSIEHLDALELVTKKEIKKNFKLHEIFADTFNLRALTIQQKEAFRKFFNYLAIDKPESIKHFDSWDQATTRGAFVKLLFRFFMEVPTTPIEIKSVITVLEPLIKMDGKGALPP